MNNIPVIPAIEKLSPMVTRILGMNPCQMTMQGTNTYLIGNGQNRILIDSGSAVPEYLNNLKSLLLDEKCTIDRLLLTHYHWVYEIS